LTFCRWSSWLLWKVWIDLWCYSQDRSGNRTI